MKMGSLISLDAIFESTAGYDDDNYRCMSREAYMLAMKKFIMQLIEMLNCHREYATCLDDVIKIIERIEIPGHNDSDNILEINSKKLYDSSTYKDKFLEYINK